MVVGQFSEEAECLIIGAGPAGRAAARRAASLGLQTVLIDSAEVPAPDGVTFVQGTARFQDPRQVNVDDGALGRFRFKKAIVTTGYESAPAPSDWPVLETITTWPPKRDVEQASSSVLVVGADRRAVEAATIYAAAGWSATLASDHDALLSDTDDALVEAVQVGLERSLKAVRLGAPINADDTASFDRIVLTAVRSASPCLGLDKARIDCDKRGAIQIDDRCATSNPRVLAAGGVTGPEIDPGRARYQGRIAAEIAAGQDSGLDARVWPRIVRSRPTVAWCGLSEKAAVAGGVPHMVRDARRAAPGEPDFSLARLVIDTESGLVMGVGLVGAGAPEAIALGVLAIEMGALAEDLAAMVHGGGSLGELVANAARS